MSNRSLIEFSHDFNPELSDEFMAALRRYLRGANRESAADLRFYGVTVIGMRHHSGNCYLDGTPDGFPAVYVPRLPPAENDADGAAAIKPQPQV